VNTFRSLVIIAAAALLGACVTGQSGSGTVASRTSVTIQNPNPEKWTPLRLTAQPANSKVSFWTCKPLACAGSAIVAAELGRASTRNPDKIALEKSAKLLATEAKAQDLMVEAASEGDERITPLSSRVTEFRGYPSIMAETKRTSRGKPSYVVRADIFVGLVLVRFRSLSTDRAEAKRNLESFVASMDIIDVEPPTPGQGQAATPVALEQAQSSTVAP